jgi:hypothetical protein
MHRCFPNPAHGFSWAGPMEGDAGWDLNPGAAEHQPGADYLFPVVQDFEPSGGGE